MNTLLIAAVLALTAKLCGPTAVHGTKIAVHGTKAAVVHTHHAVSRVMHRK